MQNILDKLYKCKILNQSESHYLFSAIIKGQLHPIQLAAVLIAMKIRGEHFEEIVGAVSALLQEVKPFPRPDYTFADIVGTGGDGSNSINISTISSFVSASCGFKIAKHGSSSVSSKTGSSDLIASFGINLNMCATQARKALDDLNICFLYAPHYHPGLRYVNPVRQYLRTRTIFNIVGPLLNPARPLLAMIGVYSSELLLPIAKALKVIGYQRAVVVHGGGMDEVVLHSPTQVAELKNGEINIYQVTQKSFGLNSYNIKALTGGTAEDNRKCVINLFQGKGDPAHEYTVAANVSLLLKIFGNEDLHDNTEYAITMIRSGNVYERVLALAERG